MSMFDRIVRIDPPLKCPRGHVLTCDWQFKDWACGLYDYEIVDGRIVLLESPIGTGGATKPEDVVGQINWAFGECNECPGVPAVFANIDVEHGRVVRTETFFWGEDEEEEDAR